MSSTGGVGGTAHNVICLVGRLPATRRNHGAEGRGRHEVGPNAFHLELQIGDSVLVMELADPPHASGMPGTTYVYVPDVDASHAAALAAGVSEVSAPEGKPYGKRQSGIRDDYGNIWWIATFDH